VPATVSSLAVRCSSPGTVSSIDSWFEQHSTSLTSLKQCSIVFSRRVPKLLKGPHLFRPQLRQLTLHISALDDDDDDDDDEEEEEEEKPADGFPDVLHGCTGLTLLDLQLGRHQNTAAATAAIAAMPALQSLKLEGCPFMAREWLLSMAHSPAAATLQQLTKLSLCCDGLWKPEEVAKLQQLSRLTQLGHLKLTCIPNQGLPGGVPPQLSALTCLDVHYSHGYDAADQFQHLSSLTALRELSVSSSDLVADTLSGLQQLSKLTMLQVSSHAMNLSASSTDTWACMTVLQSLDLNYCSVQPEVISSLTQLRALSLLFVNFWGSSSMSMDDALAAVSQLSLLTSLLFDPRAPGAGLALPPAAAFTALTASSYLCSLDLSLSAQHAPDGCVLFRPGTWYPHLQSIKICPDIWATPELE
jgi:hypothetical protein